MQWPSPWGQGYPGWHLECSVMSMKYLGESIDIHGGGLDNQFPHHECEIAQSEAATGKPFVKYWLHNNMVTIDGQKMSKSLGNFKSLPDLFADYGAMTIRFFILQGHYRSPQDFSDQALDAARKGYQRLSKTVQEVKSLAGPVDENMPYDGLESFKDRFFDFMQDDFNTAGAVSVLFDLAREAQNRMKDSIDAVPLKPFARLFDELGEKILGLRFATDSGSASGSGMEPDLIALILELRQKFREAKDWAASDAIRDRFRELGLLIEDGTDGATWRKA
jgi:cysteinyl-tRNA synthetase